MESVWKPYVRSAEDDWTQITDLKERRKIQNRLSQRAKRMKRGNLKVKHASVLSPQQDPIPCEVVLENNSIPSMDKTLATTNLTNFEPHEGRSDMGSVVTSSTQSGSLATLPDLVFEGDVFALDLALPVADTQFLILQPLRACEAFARIIIVLNLQCTHDKDVCNPVAFNIPTNLIPTREQRTIPHLMYIDILPWASLRKNLLTRLHTLNELEFTNDIQGDHLRVWGTTPWDPMGWEVSEEFLNKWFFLLDTTVLLSTNFWRGQRGEPALSFPNNWNAIEC